VIWLKYVIIGALFFIFSLLQASFFPYFTIGGAVPSLVFTLYFIIIFFEHPQNRVAGVWTAVIAGIISDMFLAAPFGVSIAAFLIIYLLHAAGSYFLRSGQSRHLVFYFIGMFSVLFLAYRGLLYLTGGFFKFDSGLDTTMVISLAYSLMFAIIGFYVGQKIFSKNVNNQLKLL